MKKRLSRRAVLRGIGGVAVALPALEIMGSASRIGGRASADDHAPPKRFMVGYVAASTGTYTRAPDRTTIHADMITPSTIGAGYDLPRSLVTLAGGAVGGIDYGDVSGDVTVVTGLKIPWQTGSSVPDGGRTAPFHGNTIISQVAGCKSLDRGRAPSSPTCDQLVASAIGGDTRFPVLSYRVQPIDYYNGNASMGNMGRLSWRRGDDGDIEAIDPIVSPRLAYESLFTGFAPSDPAEAERARIELRRRRTVIDLVRGSTDRLLGRLGGEDRRRLERHFDEIRTFERRLDTLEDPAVGACELLPHPGDDPAIGEANNEGMETETNKWSDEERRAEVLCDLIHMAFTCDLSRSASLLFEKWKSYINMFPATGTVRRDLHDCTHNSLTDLSDSIAWHVKHFARLAYKLRETPEVDGSSVLDHCALTLIFEGGHGYDPEGSRDNSSHSTENMTVLVAGRAGGLRAGHHIVAEGAHPAQVLLSGMAGCGVEDHRLGDITTVLPELFG